MEAECKEPVLAGLPRAVAPASTTKPVGGALPLKDPPLAAGNGPTEPGAATLRGEAAPPMPGACRALADLPAGAHLDAGQLARALGRCKKTVERAVRRGELPAGVRFLGRRVWLVGSVQEHLAARHEAAMRRAARRGIPADSA